MAGGLHEEFRDRQKVEGGTDRDFGFVVGGILCAIALIAWVFGETGFGWFETVFLAIGAPLVALAATKPDLLAPLNKLWTQFGLLLFKVVSPLTMLFLFAVTIVPAGLIMRLVGYDPMRRKKDPDAASYWIAREPPGPEPETMKNPF